MPDEQTPTPHLEKLFREVAEDEFWAIRGKTINGYADLEQSLCQLFAFLGGIEPVVAGIIKCRCHRCRTNQRLGHQRGYLARS